VNNWLHFYNATGPLINLSVFISHDPVIIWMDWKLPELFYPAGRFLCVYT
jgi:hypothetical protein